MIKCSHFLKQTIITVERNEFKNKKQMQFYEIVLQIYECVWQFLLLLFCNLIKDSEH